MQKGQPNQNRNPLKWIQVFMQVKILKSYARYLSADTYTHTCTNIYVNVYTYIYSLALSAEKAQKEWEWYLDSSKYT